ncbi:branched-chain amino acid ABC transporter permease [Oceanicella actignis]|uniref:Branched-chain amino acid transport system permease protein n=1 Tax=Oceanicella actignis TaxID=1189325 RepID=A0A1M7TKY7_9RHOB|nr:branched-chain amino acid ABC transporter permease [Oceanicella actignis]SET68656.1 amino acid/amide ABC transporter membrane protein 1, HAAT family [Oceanicella actignis]SHN71308.1 branched-chain amino acid transport system permease protein [Oceanicella actignis]
MSPVFLNTLEVILNGLMAGVMYSLVALGFVLIYKASGIFNYAQGVMALFAALTLVGLQTGQVPFSHLINAIFGTEVHHFGWELPALAAIVLTLGVMVIFAILVERLVLRHLVGQEPIILFMATIGLAYFMEGFGDLMWGSDIKKLDVGLPSGGSFWLEDVTRGWAAEGADYYGMYIDLLDVWAAIVATILVVSLTLFSQYTKTGRALRAVADDHQAALSVGIDLRTIWVITWAIAGFVALVAGVMWGAKSGVQFSLSLIALKALPVLMLGGFTSIPGAIVGGLIIGVGEKLFEYAIGPMLGGATENWFAYVLALLFLVFRPQGLFGEKIIERV